MSFVGVVCPECGYAKTINASGTCRCGAFLIHHFSGKTKWVKSPKRAWVMEDGQWKRYRELSSQLENKED